MSDYSDCFTGLRARKSYDPETDDLEKEEPRNLKVRMDQTAPKNIFQANEPDEPPMGHCSQPCSRRPEIGIYRSADRPSCPPLSGLTAY